MKNMGKDYGVESEKYFIRTVTESDFEDMKALLKENEYLGMLWSAELLPDDKLDDLVKRLYINMENNYVVIEKSSNKFLGHMSILVSEQEGELSVRMRENVDMFEVLGLFGKVIKEVGPAEQKNLTIQYCFE